MKPQLAFLALPILSASVAVHHRQRCSYGDSCWPTEVEWQKFNASISGRLIRTYPSAAVCHTDRYDAAQCAVAKENWKNSFWRTNQTGAYSAILWELGEKGQCFIDSLKEAPCDQGIGERHDTPAHVNIKLIVCPSFTLLRRCTRGEGCPSRCEICRKKGPLSSCEKYWTRSVRSVSDPRYPHLLTIYQSWSLQWPGGLLDMDA